MPAAKRILTYGVTGSGKTTFAMRLSERTGIPWHSVDDLAFLANWVPTSTEFQVEKISEICAQDEWILDTAYSKWIDIPLARADLILALDYPRWFSLGRLVKRTFLRLFDKKPICNGNRESLRTLFKRDNIIAWHFQSFSRKRERMRKWATQEGGPQVLVFPTAKAEEDWLRSVDPPERGNHSAPRVPGFNPARTAG